MNTQLNFNRFLLIFIAFIAAMILARIFYSHSIRYIFLLWNLFLAWLPYVLSKLFSLYYNKEKYKQVILFSSWLLFFPNALYIITDLIHLQESTNVPLWYDAILLFASSFAGLVMAFVSLQRAEHYLSGIFSKRAVQFIIPAILFLGAFGVYLGRFQRWNSWNVINDPLALGMDISSFIFNPHDNIRTWAITLILTAMYSILYVFIKLIPYAFSETNVPVKR